jgi:hypothetical protein
MSMSELLRPENLSTYLRGLERRIAGLERDRQTSLHNLITNPSNDAIERANATWSAVFDVRVPLATHDEVFVRVQAYIDPGVTAELRLQATSVVGTPATDPQFITSTNAGTPTQVQWAWRIPGLDIGQPVNIQVQSQRTSGLGSVFVYWPNSAWMGLVPNATNDGMAPP